MTLRLALALVTVAVSCAVGALILGEYEFEGATAIGAGVLFGLVVSEIALEIGRVRGPVMAIACAAMVAAGLARAAYVSSGEGLRPFPTGGWMAIVLAVLTVGLRVAWPVRSRDDVTVTD